MKLREVDERVNSLFHGVAKNYLSESYAASYPLPNTWLTRFLADERCDRMKRRYLSSLDTRSEAAQRRMLLFDANR